MLYIRSMLSEPELVIAESNLVLFVFNTFLKIENDLNHNLKSFWKWILKLEYVDIVRVSSVVRHICSVENEYDLKAKDTRRIILFIFLFIGAHNLAVLQTFYDYNNYFQFLSRNFATKVEIWKMTIFSS